MSPSDPSNDTKRQQAVLRAVERAAGELRRGGLLLLHDDAGQALLIQAAEGISETSRADMAALGGSEPVLLLTRQRAKRLGLIPKPGEAAGLESGPPTMSTPTPTTVPGPVLAVVVGACSATAIAELADPTTRRPDAPGTEALDCVALAPDRGAMATAAVNLAKIARLLPAVLAAPFAIETALGGDPRAFAAQHDLLAVSLAEVEAYRFAAAGSLRQVADARVPLAGAEDTRILAFRPSDGGVEHLAILIGSPEAGAPVLTRLHSECFTGDLLGSLRCDCGDQLRGAIQAIAEAGSGVLLYLAQEGRGIGLVNKLRAYSLQDLGADTFEANEQLGFDADERVFLPAAEILRQLGFEAVRLLTNNPDKIEGLERSGVAVAERVPHSFPSNGHNEFYLAAKAVRGHLF